MAAEQFVIKRAERHHARLRLAIAAASGGGKTWTAIEIAFGIVEELISRGELSGTLEGKVGLVDTERRSGHLYSHLGPYDVVELGPPFTVARYVGAMQALERAGVRVIILDSISHGWMGQGGVLALLDQFEARDRFSQFGKTLNPAQDEFVDAMLRSPCDVIATMRSKTAWVIEEVERNGRTVKAPRRIGLAPVQRPGIEYEFTTLLDLDTQTHAAAVVKNRCPVFQDWAPKRITREHGRALAAWLMEGAPEPQEPVSGTPSERAEATAAAVLRALERAENGPDLQRIFVEGVRAVRAFGEFVGHEGAPKLANLESQITLVKDRRKRELGLEAPVKPAVPIAPELAADIEQLVADVGQTKEAALEAFGCARFMLLPAGRVQAAIDWLSDESLANLGRPLALTKRLTAAGAVVKAKADAWAGMEDDLPWK